MLARRPDLPRFMPNGLDNPLGGHVMDFHKMAVILSVLWITAATTMTLASAQDAALSERERQGMRQPLSVEISNQGRRLE
jgi:hypothetical protein